MKEAEGRYKHNTKYVWQIKHESKTFYNDNATSDMFDSKGDFFKWVERQDTTNLKTRVIKRTTKEDIINT